MKPLFILTLLSGAMLLQAGVCPISNPNSFRLPSDAAPGGRVRAQLKTDAPKLKLYLNHRFLGIYLPRKGEIELDLTPAVFYGSNLNQLADASGNLINQLQLTYDERIPENLTIQTLRKEKVRLNTSAILNEQRGKRLKDAGFNVASGWAHIHKSTPVSAKKRSEDLVSASQMPRLEWVRNEIKMAKKSGLITLPLLWYHQETQALINASESDRACGIALIGRNATPCPCDEVYWLHLMKPTLLAMAELYKNEKAPGGALLDQEFYNGGFPGFGYGGAEDGCYCEKCLEAFCGYINIPFDKKKILSNPRAQFILEHGFTIRDYQDILSIRIHKIVRSIAEEVHRANPDFMIALMNGPTHWYYGTLARAFSLPGNPALLMPGTEYFIGFNRRSEESLQILARQGDEALYLPGYTTSAFNAEGLGAKIAEGALLADGYWLYYGEMFFSANPRIIQKGLKPSEYALREQPPRYWDAVKRANAYLSSQGTYPASSTRTAIEFPAFSDQRLNISASGIRFRNPADEPKNLVPESKRYTKWVVAKPDGTVRFDMKKMSSNEKIFSLKLEPGKKYRLSMECRGENFSHPAVGFRLIDAAQKVVTQSFLPFSGVPEWTTLSKDFTAKGEANLLVVVSYGNTGFFEFKQPRVAEITPLDAQSAAITGTGDVLNFGISALIDFSQDLVGAELINPITGLAYFQLGDRPAELRLLRKLYGNLPMALRFTGSLDRTMPFEQR